MLITLIDLINSDNLVMSVVNNWKTRMRADL